MPPMTMASPSPPPVPSATYQENPDIRTQHAVLHGGMQIVWHQLLNIIGRQGRWRSALSCCGISCGRRWQTEVAKDPRIGPQRRSLLKYFLALLVLAQPPTVHSQDRDFNVRTRGRSFKNFNLAVLGSKDLA